MTTEHEIACQVATGELPSPTIYINSVYVALRISGTGVAWRASLNEFCYRDPAIWLSEEMQRRVLGLPVVVEHPPGSVLTSRFFGERCVGSIVHAYATDEALFGVARILDAKAFELIEDAMFDTSPGVLLGDDLIYLDLPEGGKMLVEPTPTLIDHIALVYMGEGNKGVWQRGDGPGVITPDSAIVEKEAALEIAPE